MRRNRRKINGIATLRKVLLCATILSCPLFALPASASYFLPDNYFHDKPIGADENMVVEADSLEFDDATGVVVARGQVRMFYGDYAIVADLVTYDETARSVILEGNVRIREPGGDVYLADHAEFTDDFQRGFIKSLRIETTSEDFISAETLEMDGGSSRTFIKARYAPCGICLEDPKVPRGWRIKAAKIVHDQVAETIHFNHATLEVLGVPIMWIPYLSLPLASDNRRDLFHTRLSYDDDLGIGLETEVSIMRGKGYDLIFTPKLLSNQGLLLSAQWEQLLNKGSYNVKVSAIRQMHPERYAGKLGDRKIRAGIQTIGAFELGNDWTFGWDYTRFSDAAFLKDYGLTGKGDRTTNTVYVKHFSQTMQASVAFSEDVLLGEVTAAEQDKQIKALPSADYEQYFDLDNQAGRVTVKANLISLSRELDDVSTTSGVTKVHGFSGDKEHARAEISWKKQWVAPGGVLVTPYLGLRADWARYDQRSTHPTAPAVPSLITTTPIAALDVRWPLGGRTENASHLLEPIFQIAARTDEPSLVGITNDLSQGLAFDNTNLFSYERFAGFDRQETGVRANIGGRYSMMLDKGGWFEASLGQSFHLAGKNAFAENDPSLAAVGTGLETKQSDIVAGFTSKPIEELTLRGQINLKNSDFSIRRGAFGVGWTKGKHSASLDYSFIKAEPGLGVTDDLQALSAAVAFPIFNASQATLNYSIYKATPSTGVLVDQQTVGGSLMVPLTDYISSTFASQYDIDDKTFSSNSIGLDYSDGYVSMGAKYTQTGATDKDHPDDHRVGVYLNLIRLGELSTSVPVK